MEPIHGICKSTKSASEDDFIGKMPDNVITNILDRLPIQDVVKTDVLSTNWRFKWTLLTQLMFDEKFSKYLVVTRKYYDYSKTINKILLNLKGPVTKFVLFLPPDHQIFDFEVINNWFRFLSTNGINDLTLTNMHNTPLQLPTHLLSCQELKHLMLHNCRFCPKMHGFLGFPKLLNLKLNRVRFENYKFGELLSQSPLLEIMLISFNCVTGKLKQVEFANLKNLKLLTLPLCKLENMAMIKSSSIHHLLSYFPKLEQLNLILPYCKFLADAKKRVLTTTLPCLKTLKLFGLDFGNGVIVSRAFELIYGCPNLQTLEITADLYSVAPPSTFSYSDFELDFNRMGQLQIVVLKNMSGLENVACFIKWLLASSPLLKKMIIFGEFWKLGYNHYPERDIMFTTRLLKLHRASPIAEIEFIY